VIVIFNSRFLLLVLCAKQNGKGLYMPQQLPPPPPPYFARRLHLAAAPNPPFLTLLYAPTTIIHGRMVKLGTRPAL
jgi:hypothetical protein